MQKLLNTLNKFKPASIKVARYRNFKTASSLFSLALLLGCHAHSRACMLVLHSSWPHGYSRKGETARSLRNVQKIILWQCHCLNWVIH